MRWQRETRGSAFPLRGKAGRLRAGKIGRGFLASAHAGTRLPMAAAAPQIPGPYRRTQGAPPPSAPGGPGRRCVLSPSFVKNLQKSKTVRRNANRRQKSPIDSLRRHYPRQVKGRSVRFLSAFRLPCFSGPAYHRGKILSRGLQIRAEGSMINPQQKGRPLARAKRGQ